MSNGKEYSPNAPELMGNTYYVAQNDPAASDENPGSPDQPFATISRAAAVVDQGDLVIMDEGVYRGEVPIIRHGHPYQPDTFITFSGAAGKEVYLKASDIFDARWEPLGDGTHKAKLPAQLFEEGAYNPYELSCVIDDPQKVRPTEGPVLAETLGQIYVDGAALEQLDNLEAVQQTKESFVVSAEGTEIIVHFTDEQAPTDQLVELTVRERCFKPQTSGELFIRTMGMEIEHAADPGAFSYCRPLVIRSNPETGITVRKSFAVSGGICSCGSLGSLSYKNVNDSTIISTWADDKGICNGEKVAHYTVESTDAAKSWETVGVSEVGMCGYFLDEEHDLLTRYYITGYDPDGAFGARAHDVMFQFSADAGETWSEPEVIDSGSYYYRIIKLADGTLLWPYTNNMFEDSHHSRLNVLLGRWRSDLSGIDWEQGGKTEIDPQICTSGLDEPAACQLPDGRIFIILRAGNVRPTQDSPGVPSVKRFCISEDGGKTLSEAKPLTYEDGRYIYSARNYPDVWRSAKNGKVYVIINIAQASADNCDPRTTLHIAELNPETLCVKRDNIAIIETKHEEHHSLVRFSNWSAMEDRYTKNLLLFMKLSRSEHCVVRKGYDYNTYRYEIAFPG